MSQTVPLRSLAAAGMAVLMIGGGFVTATRAEATSPEIFMKKVNTNADKTISMDEVDAYARMRFAALEGDKDKTLDAKELKDRLSESGMTMADPDKDKTIDEAEFVEYADKLFKEANKTGSKTLSVEELKSPAGEKLMTLLR